MGEPASKSATTTIIQRIRPLKNIIMTVVIKIIIGSIINRALFKDSKRFTN